MEIIPGNYNNLLVSIVSSDIDIIKAWLDYINYDDNKYDKVL